MSANRVGISLKVVYKDDDSQESLSYSGETTLLPLILPPAWTLTGTPIQFCATEESLGDQVWGCTSVRKERLQNITAMNVYCKKSTDELRLEDYNYLKKSTETTTTGLTVTSSSIWDRPTLSSYGAKKTKQKSSTRNPVSRANQQSRSSSGVVFTSPMSTDPSTVSTQVQQASHRFSFSPVINFTAQTSADPREVFLPPADEAEPAPTLTVLEGKELMDSLLESIVKCMQIQNSLYRLVLLKLERWAAEPKDVNDALPGPKASNKKSTGKNQDCNPGTLLCELKGPLEALMRSAEIQRGLFQRMIAVNSMIADESADPPNDDASSGEGQESHQFNILTVLSKLEEIAFRTKMPCYYSRNPFTSQEVKAITSDDVLHHVCQDKRPFSSKAVSIRASGQRELPHGYGSLKTVTGKLLYTGDWCRGKRHGKGEGFILSVTKVDSSSVAVDHGIYSGGWKNNMRHGKGKMTFVSGVEYDGQWQYDKMTGYGTLKFPDGTIQEGTLRDGSLDGCVLFTWPHGVTEYREYRRGQGQLACSKIDKETAVRLTQTSYIRSQLLALRECAADLREENSTLKDELNTLRAGQAELNTKHKAALLELRKWFDVQRELDSEKLQKEFEQKVKDAEESKSKSSERIRELEKELEEAKGGQLCQICFENPRDCIIMPCTHLLYCRACVAEHKRKGDSRCPTCRGPISGEMLCNVNH